MVYFGKKNRFGISKISAGIGPVAITSARPRFKVRSMPSGSLSKQIVNVKKNIREMKNKEELKHYDTFPLVGTQILNQSAPTFNVLNAMDTGDLPTQREGGEVQGTSVQFRCTMNSRVSATQAFQVLRHIILYDAQANQALPTVGQILDLSVITVSVYAPYNYSFQKRFKILFDRTYVLNPNNTAESIAVTETEKIPLSRVTKYIPSAPFGTIGDINTNSLITLWLSDQGTTGQGPFVTCGYRFYFKDD